MKLWPWSIGSRRNQDLDDEIASHLAMAAQDIVDEGATPDAAAARARQEFGNIGLVKETTRAVWGFEAIGSILRDLRYALRSLRSSPVFALVAILSLAVGIGANTAIFSFVNALILQRLPVPEPSQLVKLVRMEGDKEISTGLSLPFLEELGKQSGVFDGILGRFPVRVNLSDANMSEPLSGEVVTGDYFRTLRVRPAIGRLLTDEDIAAASGNPVCVLSYATWQKRFGGDPAIVGRKLMLNARPYTVIGVTEKGFSGAVLQSRVDMQLPVSRMGDFMGGFFASGPGGKMWKSAGFSWLEPVARLKPGLTAAAVQGRVDSVAHAIRLQLADPEDRARLGNDHSSLRLSDGSQGAGGDWGYAKPVTVLMAVVALVLLIACTNVAGLLLARANARAKECAVRLSLGASRGRLIRQFLTESLMLAVAGGVAGLMLAFWIIRTLLAFLNAGLPAGAGIQVSADLKVIAFSIAVTLATAVLFGLMPAWQASRADLLPELKGAPGGGGSRWRGFATRRALIVVEIALSLVILFAAGLLTQTLRGLQAIDLGFDPERVTTLRVDPAMVGNPPARNEQIFDEILERLRAHPGIAAASIAVVSPLEGSALSNPVEVPGHVPAGSDQDPNFNAVSPGYFSTLNQRLLAGRDFTDDDMRRKASKVAIVNELFAAQYFGGANPLGRHVKVGDENREIVGLVNNSHYQTLREQARPLIYVPARTALSSGYALLVRTRSHAGATVADITRTIASVDSRLPVYGVISLRDQIDHGMSSERVLSFLAVLFSALVVLLCGMGIYGLIAYAVSRRTREIGIRLAIGATKAQVAGLFLRESGILIAAGIVLGAPLALAATRVLKGVLYGVAPGDPATLAGAVILFIGAAIAASLLPVRKAARIQPSQALRYE